MRSASRPRSRAPQSLAGVGGRSVSARWTSRRIRRSGRVPKAISARRAVPKRLVTSGKSRSRTLVKRRAGPAGRDHPPVDLRRFQLRVDRRLDGDEVAVAAELIEKGAEVGVGRRRPWRGESIRASWRWQGRNEPTGLTAPPEAPPREALPRSEVRFPPRNPPCRRPRSPVPPAFDAVAPTSGRYGPRRQARSPSAKGRCAQLWAVRPSVKADGPRSRGQRPFAKGHTLKAKDQRAHTEDRRAHVEGHSAQTWAQPGQNEGGTAPAAARYSGTRSCGLRPRRSGRTDLRATRFPWPHPGNERTETLMAAAGPT